MKYKKLSDPRKEVKLKIVDISIGERNVSHYFDISLDGVSSDLMVRK